MIQKIFLGALAASISLAFPPPAAADPGPLVLKPLVTGLSFPLFMLQPPSETDRFFIVQKVGGIIRIYTKSTDDLQPAGSPFLDIPAAEIFGSGERGLLGFAFHPDYATNGYFYVYVSTPRDVGETGFDHWSELRRYKVNAGNPDLADLASKTIVMRFQQPQGNHNAGWIGFDPTATGAEANYLYIATGDGGGGNDNNTGHNPAIGNAQDTLSLLGKILRIDTGADGDADAFPADPDKHYAIPASNPFVGNPAALDEIWAYGLRNPWRCSFDRQTGDFWIGDVGQGAREEVNFQPASSTGGENYGWRVREGFIDNGTNNDPLPVPRVDPVIDYPRTEAAGFLITNGKSYGQSITGGCVYRGTKMPWLDAHYFYADYKFERVCSFKYDSGAGSIVAGTHTDRTLELGLPDDANNATNRLSSFAEDNAGNLYLINRGAGTVFEITQNDWYLWRNQKFTVAELALPSISGIAGNPDFDDMNNIMEFVAGREPRTVDGPFPSTMTQETDGGTETFLTLTLTRDPQSFGVVSVEGAVSGDLFSFSGGTDVTVLIDDSTTFKFRDNVPADPGVAPGARRFGRFNFLEP